MKGFKTMSLALSLFSNERADVFLSFIARFLFCLFISLKQSRTDKGPERQGEKNVLHYFYLLNS